MKILVVTSFFPSSAQDKLPQFLLDQAQAFASHYPDMKFVYLAASREGHSEPVTLADNLQVYRFDYFRPRKYQLLTEYGIMSAIKKFKLSALTLPFLFLFEYLAMRKMIIQEKPDYVYAHWMLPQGVLAYKLCKMWGIKLVLTSHSSDIEVMFKLGNWGKRLAQKVLSYVTAINVVSQRGRDFLQANLEEDDFKAVDEKLAVLPMGVPLSLPENVMPLKAQLPQSDSLATKAQIELLFLGRFAEKKGIYYLLEAIEGLQIEYPNLHLTLAGEGLMKDEVAAYIVKHGLQNMVTMTGFVGGESKYATLAKADIFILPSFTTDSGDREGLPVTLIENMSVGNLCIATTGSGAEELIEDGICGYLMPPRDAGAIAENIHKLLNQPEATLERMREMAVEHSSRLRWGKLIQAYKDHLFR